MFHKLHRRDAAAASTVRGLSCNEAGVFFGGGCALVEPHLVKGRVTYRVRATEEINTALAAGFGAQVDISPHLPTLRRVADLMTDGQWGLAQITALRMRLPELADDEAVERLLKAEDLMRFNPNHKPAGPGGGQVDTGTARFYEGLTAADLTRLGFAVGNVQGQGPNLMNTYNDPKLPITNASNTVVRVSRNRF